MNTFNFSEFQAPTIVNKRKESALPSKVQEFDDLKYRKMVTKKGEVKGQFYISKKRFEELNLTEFALSHFTHPSQKGVVLLGVVEDKDGKYLKKRKDREKGTQFKSEVLEEVLNAAGIIDTSDASLKLNQFIKITEVGRDVTLGKTPVKIAFQITKGAKKEVVKEEVADKQAETVKAAPAPVANDVPQAQPSAPVADAAQPAEEAWT